MKADGPGDILFAWPDQPPLLDLYEPDLPSGSVTVISGENGSGKTTLMKILAGLLVPGGGTSQKLRAFAEDTSYLHQHPYLFRGTVGRNLAMAAPEADRHVRRAALAMVGLENIQDRRARKLSGGEAKRVALARCFLSDRRTMLLDEPAAHVDAASIRLIEKACRAMAAEGRRVVVTSHRGGFGYRVADRILELSDGRLIHTSRNILHGEVIHEDAGHLYFRSGGITFRVPARDGDYSVAVLPGEDIILSSGKLDSSARNSLKGVLTGLKSGQAGSVSVTVDCGIELRAIVTDLAVDDLGLEAGKEIYATFKASSVALY